jgi:hypothetical protein
MHVVRRTSVVSLLAANAFLLMSDTVRPEAVDGNTISGIRRPASSFLLNGVDISQQLANSTAAPSAAVDISTGGKILSASTNPRQIQFALKLYF